MGAPCSRALIQRGKNVIGQRARRCKLQRSGRFPGNLLCFSPQAVQSANRVKRTGLYVFTGVGERGALWGANKQTNAHPLFKRADPSAERGLGNMSGVCSTYKTAVLGKGGKVL